MQKFSVTYLLAIRFQKCTNSIYQYMPLQQIKGEEHIWTDVEEAYDKIKQLTLIKIIKILGKEIA